MTPAERYAAAVQAVATGVSAWNLERRTFGAGDFQDLWLSLPCRSKIARAVLAAVDGDERLERVEPYPRPYPWGPAGDSDADSAGQGTGGNASGRSPAPVCGPNEPLASGDTGAVTGRTAAGGTA